MRTLLFELRPAALLAADLGLLLHQLGDVLTGHTRSPVTVTAEGQAPLPAEVKLAVYRIAQEAFNNIAKHARAAAVRVTCRVSPDALVLAVCDEGQGFDPATVAADHLGLRIMAERAAGIGTEVDIRSAPGCGTEVVVRWRQPGA